MGHSQEVKFNNIHTWMYSMHCSWHIHCSLRYNNLHIHYNLSIKSIVMFLLSSLGQPSTGVSMREIGIKSYEWTCMPIKKKESPNIYNEQVIPPENETHSHQFWCNGALHGLELNSWEGDWFIQYLLTLQYKQCW